MSIYNPSECYVLTLCTVCHWTAFCYTVYYMLFNCTYVTVSVLVVVIVVEVEETVVVIVVVVSIVVEIVV